MSQYDGSVIINTGLDIKNLKKDANAAVSQLQKLSTASAKIASDIKSGLNRALPTQKMAGKIDDVKKKIDGLESQLREFAATEIQTTEFTNLSSELDKAYKKLEALLAKEKKLNALGVSEESAQWKSLQYDLEMAARKYAELEAIRDEMIAYGEATVSGAETEEYKKLSGALEEAKIKLAALQKQQEKNAAASGKSSAMEAMANKVRKATDGIAKSTARFSSRLREIVRGALVFNLISAGLRKMTSYFSKALNSNKEFATATTQLKSVLATAFQPVYEVVVPALTNLVRILTVAVQAVGKFFAAITGKSYSEMQKNAAALNDQANAINGVSSAAKDAQKDLAGFDEINRLSGQDSGGGSGGGSSADTPEIPDIELPSWIQKAADKLKSIGDYIPIIATGLAGLKIGGLISDLVTAGIKATSLSDKIKLLGKKTMITLGVTLAITGIALETKGIAETIQKGLDGESFAEILGGGGMVTVGGALIGKALGSVILGSGLGAIVAGVPAYFTGIYDACTQGLSWLNAALVGAGATAAGAGIGAIIGSLGGPIGTGVGALIGLAVGLVTDGVLLIVDKWEDIKEWFSNLGTWFDEHVIQPIAEFFSGLWEGISTAASDCWTAICDFFQPAIDWFSELFGSIKQTVDDVFYNIGVIASGCWQIIKKVWSIVSTWFDEHVIQPIAEFFSGLWEGISTAATNVWNSVKNAARDAWDGIKSVFSSVGKFFSDVFSKAWEKVVKVFSPIGEVFVKIKDAIVSSFKKVVNGLITGLNKIIAVPFNGINYALEKIKGIEILGLTPFKGLRTISVPEIPYLANGAVIPPKAPFAAILGDQRSGTNIEAPLDTIKQAVAEVLRGISGGNPNFHVTIVLDSVDGKKLFDAVVRQNNAVVRATGSSPLKV